MRYKRNRKRILALLVVVGAIIISFFVLSPSGDKTSDVSVNNPTESGNSSFQFESGGYDVLSGNALGVLQVRGETGNLTEALIQSYAKRVFENKDALLSAEDITADAQKSVGAELNVPRFSAGDIAVSDNNSKAGQIAYIETVGAALYENFKELEGKTAIVMLQSFLEDDDPASLYRFVKSIPVYIDDLLEIEAPSLWAPLHLQMLNLWQRKLVTYRAILDFESDPLKAFVAFQQLSDVLQEDENIQRIIFQRAEELESGSS